MLWSEPLGLHTAGAIRVETVQFRILFKLLKWLHGQKQANILYFAFYMECIVD